MATLLLWGCGGGSAATGDGPAGAAPGGDAGQGAGLFADATSRLGIDFDLDRSVSGDYFMPDSMAPGVALVDYDGDGDLDIYLVNGFRDADGRLDTPQGANRLFRQEPDGRFTDATAESGLGDTGYGMGVAAGDYDNDGDTDLYVTCYGPDRLYRNNGDGTFANVTGAAGIANPAWSASAVFFDADADGFLDLYVTNYLDYDETRATDSAGRPEYAAPERYPGVPDVLYRNNGDGTFTDAGAEAGIATPGRGLGVVCSDLDDDGRLDLYVANDRDPNFAWINLGDGTFEDRALAMGLALNGHGRAEASMGLACGDTDGDGRDELLLTHLVGEHNTLYRRTASGGWEDATVARGLGASSIDDTGFGTDLIDVDLDGDLDLVVVNGRVLRALPRTAPTVSAHWRPYAEPNRLLLNDGTGRFALERMCGSLCDDVEVSRGLATGDIDGDGDLDVVVSNASGSLKVYRNDAQHHGRWLIVRAFDPALGRDAAGAIVEVRAGARVWRRRADPARSYLSSGDPRAHFGLGAVAGVDSITVTWPDGSREAYGGGGLDRVLEVRKGLGRAVP